MNGNQDAGMVAQERGHIAIELDRQFKCIDELGETIESLDAELKSIQASPEPELNQKLAVAREVIAKSPLAERISDHNIRLAFFVARLREIRERLDL